MYQSTVVWEQASTKKKKELSCPSLGMKEGSPKRGLVSEEVFGFFLPYMCWHSEGWTPRNEALMESVVKQV